MTYRAPSKKNQHIRHFRRLEKIGLGQSELRF
jgi:hypothetical protein